PDADGRAAGDRSQDAGEMAERSGVSSRPLAVRQILFPCALLLCALAGAAPARAAGLPLLVVHRTDDTAGCPDARALAAAVAEQMKRPALQPVDVLPGPDRGLDVQIYKSSAGYTPVILAGGKTRQPTA